MTSRPPLVTSPWSFAEFFRRVSIFRLLPRWKKAEEDEAEEDEAEEVIGEKCRRGWGHLWQAVYWCETSTRIKDLSKIEELSAASSHLNRCCPISALRRNCASLVFTMPKAMKAGSQERSTHMDGQSGSLKSDGNLFMFLFQNRFFIWWMSVKTMSVRINMAIMSEGACRYSFEIEHGSLLCYVIRLWQKDEFFDANYFSCSLWDIKHFASSFSSFFTMPWRPRRQLSWVYYWVFDCLIVTLNDICISMELHIFDILMVFAPLYSLVVHNDEVSVVVCVDKMKWIPLENSCIIKLRGFICFVSNPLRSRIG